MPREYSVKEAVDFLQSRNPDLMIKEDTIYHKINRGELPAEKRATPNGKRYMIKEEDLRRARFRRPKQGGVSPESNRVQLDWPEILEVPREFWLKWKPVEIHSDEDMNRLVSIFGELVDDEGLRTMLHDLYGVWYKPTTFKQRRWRGTLLAVGWSASRGGWWYPKKSIKKLWWRPHVVKGDKED